MFHYISKFFKFLIPYFLIDPLDFFKFKYFQDFLIIFNKFSKILLI